MYLVSATDWMTFLTFELKALEGPRLRLTRFRGNRFRFPTKRLPIPSITENKRMIIIHERGGRGRSPPALRR